LVRAFKFLGLLAALAAVFPVVGGATPARVAANSVTFQASSPSDPQAPNITTVTVSNDNSGMITFQINIPNQASLSGDKITDIEVDADNNPATGSPDVLDKGADLAIELFQGQVTLFQWDGTTFSRTAAGPSQATLIFLDTPGGPTIKINASELNGTKKFGFNVTSIAGVTTDSAGNLDFTNAHFDLAPAAGHGLWMYDVKTAPLKLKAKNFKTAPSRPRAGSPFSMMMTAIRNDTGAALQSGTVNCAATAGGSGLAVRVHRIANTVAQCTWQIPGSARGRTFRGSITVVFEGKKVTKTFTASIG
jgi:hypothetical protein